MPRFHLLRYFTLTSFGIMVGVTVLVGQLNGQNTRKLLVAEAEAHAAESTRALARQIYDDYVWPRRVAGQDPDPLDPEEYAALDYIVGREIADRHITQVNLFDVEGRVLYSMERDLVGKLAEAESHVYGGVQGLESSDLHLESEAPPKPHLGHAVFRGAYIETYIPLATLAHVPEEHWAPMAVVETYQDATHITQQVQAGMRRAMAESALSGLALFTALLLVVNKAHRTLRQQHDALEHWNTDLERRVDDRTAELTRSTDDMRRLFNGITDGIGLLGPDLSVRAINDGLRSLVTETGGAPPRGRYCYERYARRKAPCTGCPAAQSIAAGEPASGTVTWHIGGRARHFEITTFPLTSGNGEAPRLIEYVKEVTDRRDMEQQLIQAERLASIGVLAAGVAHEINNPLASVAQCADSAQRQLAAAANGASGLRDYLEIIRREVDRCKSITQNLLDFARPSRSAREVADVGDIICDTYALLRLRFDQFGIQWTNESTGEPLTVVTDSTKLRQILFNLLHNAIDACAETDGTVTCRADRVPQGVRIVIHDSGKGLDADMLQHMFEPFYTTKAAGEGTGLGLSLAYGIASELGGTLEATSDGPGHGATFTLTIPEHAPA